MPAAVKPTHPICGNLEAQGSRGERPIELWLPSLCSWGRSGETVPAEICPEALTVLQAHCQTCQALTARHPVLREELLVLGEPGPGHGRGVYSQVLVITGQ